MNELETIRSRIHEIRGARVMLDFDLAKMYGVETKALNQAVKRNIERFPEDFMFQLTKGEWEILRSQIATANLTENQTDDALRSQIATIKSGDNQENDALRSQIVTTNHGDRNPDLPLRFYHCSSPHDSQMKPVGGIAPLAGFGR